MNVMIGIPVLLLGGTEIQTLTLVKALIEKKYCVTVCCYYNYDEVMTEMIEKAGAKLLLLKLDRSAGLFHLLLNLKLLFSASRPDIVHVQYIAPGLIPLLAATLARVPKVFATVHQPGRTYGWKMRLMLRCAARLCTVFFCNSLAVERSWFGKATLFDPQRKHPGRHCTIYNAVDAERIASIVACADRVALRAALDIGDQPVVGVVGRLRQEKGQAVLLEAMAQVIKDLPSALLLVVGDGPDRNDLQQQSEQLGITDNVRWLGQQKTEDVFKLYSVMNVLAVPSIFEGFGLVAAEAMAARLPVVGSAVDGLMEIIIDHETGRVTPPQDAEALAAAILQLLLSPEAAIRMGMKGEQHLLKHFSLRGFSENITAAYAAFQGSR